MIFLRFLEFRIDKIVDFMRNSRNQHFSKFTRVSLVSLKSFGSSNSVDPCFSNNWRLSRKSITRVENHDQAAIRNNRYGPLILESFLIQLLSFLRDFGGNNVHPKLFPRGEKLSILALKVDY